MRTIGFTCPVCREAGVAQFEETGDQRLDSVLSGLGRLLVHDECYDGRERALAARRTFALQAAQGRSWKTLCPLEFHQRLQRLSGRRATLLQKLDSWAFGPQGLYVCGPGQRCKTRFCWHVLKREFLAGRSIVALTHPELRQRLSALMSDSSRAAVDWLALLGRTDILFIDDLGKGHTTSASEEALYDLVDVRYRNRRPTIYTSEFDARQACARMSEERATAIVRRIMETTLMVEA